MPPEERILKVNDNELFAVNAERKGILLKAVLPIDDLITRKLATLSAMGQACKGSMQQTQIFLPLTPMEKEKAT